MDEPLAEYGIIGNPLKHSLSPVMHNKAFELLDVPAVYKLFPLQENELSDFFSDLKKKDSPIFGLNVTVPYKEIVLQYLDSLSPFAQKAGAVNTIVIDDKRSLIGHNTDGPGFLAHLAELQFNSENKSISIIGAGGSARAIISALCTIPERPKLIRIYNRTTLRVDNLINDLKQRINVENVVDVMSIEDLNIHEADLLINTTSVGLQADDPCLVEEDLLHSDLLVYDLIYNPAETSLLKAAKEKGARVANGLGMLYYQGILAFEHWAEMQIDEQIKIQMREVLEDACDYK